MRTIKTFIAVPALLITTSFVANAQQNPMVQSLESQYALTKPTADNSDIVTAGAVLVLQKDNLMMVVTSSSNLYQNTYKDGKISQNTLGKFAGLGRRLPGFTNEGGTTRIFVTGEKMWVTKIDLKDNAVVFDLLTDALGDNRYKAAISIPFPKGPPPTADQLSKMIGEVFKVQPSDDASGSGQQQAPAGAAPAAATPPAQQSADTPPPPIAPPPPPPDEPPPTPKTVSLKETTDLVVADFGQPQKIVKLGTKEIYYYKDFKVTFVGGKVTDVE